MDAHESAATRRHDRRPTPGRYESEELENSSFWMSDEPDPWQHDGWGPVRRRPPDPRVTDD